MKNELKRYGKLDVVQNVTDALKTTGKVDIEAFTDVFHVKFEKLERARRAKRFLDAKNFYGGVLHISYAPERETIHELKEKLHQRKREVEFCLKRNTRGKTSEITAQRETDFMEPPHKRSRVQNISRHHCHEMKQ